MKFSLSNWFGVTSSLAFAAAFSSSSAYDKDRYFQRVSTFDVCEQAMTFPGDEAIPNCNFSDKTEAGFLEFFTEGNKTKLMYTDQGLGVLGFVDISDPSDPKADGVVVLEGAPKTVRRIGDLAVVGVRNGFASGDVVFSKLSNRTTLTEEGVPVGLPETIEIRIEEDLLEGKPETIDASKEDSGFPKYIAIVFENSGLVRPGPPPGFLVILTIASEADLADPTTWSPKLVELTGLPGCRFDDDPEPEFVAINDDNTKAVVTMQENNCNVIVDLASGTIIDAFNASSVDLTSIDVLTEGVIRQNATGTFLREPDGVAWIGSTNYFATANEGDLDGGSRGFTIFDADTGAVIYDSGNTMDKEAVRIGQYPESRSKKKGNEPENILYGEINDLKFLFVSSEQSSCVFVYEVSDPANPDLVQILPTGVTPEGLAFNQEQKLLAVAADSDKREEGFRSSITFFKLAKATKAEYPTLESTFRKDLTDTYIPFGALSGLAAAPNRCSIIYAVENSFYRKSRILSIDTSTSPPCIVEENYIMDTNFQSGQDDLRNDDMTVNLDLTGIAARPDGGFWVCSKANDKVYSISADYVIEEYYESIGSMTGLDVDGDTVVIVQGTSSSSSNPIIMSLNTNTGVTNTREFVLPTPTSQNGGKVCLTDIAFAGDGKYYVLLGDDQGGPDATIKQIYTIDLGDYTNTTLTVDSELYLDLIPSLTASNGPVPWKVEGLAIDDLGNVFVVNDNIGVRETFFGKVDKISPTKMVKGSKKCKKEKKGHKTPKA